MVYQEVKLRHVITIINLSAAAFYIEYPSGGS